LRLRAKRRLHAAPALLGALLCACAAGRAEAPREEPASAADDPLAELVRNVRAKPDAYTYRHLALAVAAEVYPDLTPTRREEFGQEIERLAERLKTRLAGAKTGKEKVQRTTALLFDELHLKTAPAEKPEQEEADNYFPHRALARKQGVCLGLSMLYLMLGEQAGLPFFPVHAPQHLYVRYDDGKEHYGVEATEAGKLIDEEDFRKRYHLEPAQAAAAGYFAALGKLEALGDLLNAAAWFSALERVPRPLPAARSVLAARLCVEIAPRDFNNWDTLAQAYAAARRPAEALAAMRQAVALRPPVSGRQDRQYWEERLKRFEAAATRKEGDPSPAPR
jgi:regulator of sirC expression with transglutaminase-like and TPR domain